MDPHLESTQTEDRLAIAERELLKARGEKERLAREMATLKAEKERMEKEGKEAAERLSAQLETAEEKVKTLETQTQQRQRTKDESMSLLQSQLEQLQQTVLKKQLMLDALSSEKSALEYRLADALRDKARSQSLRRGR